MGIIRQRLRVAGPRGDEEPEVLFDSGSTYSLINSILARKIAKPITLHKPREFIVADGHTVGSNHIVDLAVTIGERLIGLTAYVVDKLPAELIFGVLDMEAYRIKLDPRRRKLDLSEFTGQIYAL